MKWRQKSVPGTAGSKAASENALGTAGLMEVQANALGIASMAAMANVDGTISMEGKFDNTLAAEKYCTPMK